MISKLGTIGSRVKVLLPAVVTVLSAIAAAIVATNQIIDEFKNISASTRGVRDNWRGSAPARATNSPIGLDTKES